MLTLTGLAVSTAGAAGGGEAADSREIKRARREVKLLDDIYKTAIVLITKHYVDEKSDLAAGEAFKVLFASVKEKGWHEVRLLDATGDPLNSENSPADAFERRAIKALLDKQPYYEEVVDKDGKQYLRGDTDTRGDGKVHVVPRQLSGQQVDRWCAGLYVAAGARGAVIHGCEAFQGAGACSGQ